MVTGTGKYALAFYAKYVRRGVILFYRVDNAVVEQKAVNCFQWNRRNGLADWRAAGAWRELDGAAIGNYARLAVDVNQTEDITGINQVRVVYLRVDMPDFR